RRGPRATCAVRARPARTVPDPHGPPNVRSRSTGDLRTGAPGRIRTRCRSGNLTWQRGAETPSAAPLRAFVAARAPFGPARSRRRPRQRPEPPQNPSAAPPCPSPPPLVPHLAVVTPSCRPTALPRRRTLSATTQPPPPGATRRANRGAFSGRTAFIFAAIG